MYIYAYINYIYIYTHIYIHTYIPGFSLVFHPTKPGETETKRFFQPSGRGRGLLPAAACPGALLDLEIQQLGGAPGGAASSEVSFIRKGKGS